MENLTFHGDRRGDWLVIQVVGTVDLATAPALKSRLIGLVDHGEPRLVVDLSGVPFIDSTGLGALVAVMNAIKANFGRLRVVATGPQLLTVLDISGLLSVLDVFTSVDDAVLADGHSSPLRAFDRAAASPG